MGFFGFCANPGQTTLKHALLGVRSEAVLYIQHTTCACVCSCCGTHCNAADAATAATATAAAAAQTLEGTQTKLLSANTAAAVTWQKKQNNNSEVRHARLRLWSSLPAEVSTPPAARRGTRVGGGTTPTSPTPPRASESPPPARLDRFKQIGEEGGHLRQNKTT